MIVDNYFNIEIRISHNIIEIINIDILHVNIDKDHFKFKLEWYLNYYTKNYDRNIINTITSFIDIFLVTEKLNMDYKLKIGNIIIDKKYKDILNILKPFPIYDMNFGTPYSIPEVFDIDFETEEEYVTGNITTVDLTIDIQPAIGKPSIKHIRDWIHSVYSDKEDE